MINSNDIVRNGIQWGSVDNFVGKLKDRIPMVVNTDVSNGSGIHWICVILVDGTVYIIDSLGPSNFRPYDNLMLTNLAQAGYDYAFYDGRFQWDNDSLCGWFAIYVAKVLKDSPDRLTPKLVFDIVYDAFGRDPDDGDIQKLIESFGLNQK